MKPSLVGALCDSAEAILRLEPWQWMDEFEMFALQPEENGEIYFVSVMGAAGEHEAVAYYPGRESLYKLLAAHDSGGDEQHTLEAILLNSHLQVAFESRAGLQPAERRALKQAGRSYRGRWPVFRSHAAATVPWPVDEAQAEVLSRLLSGTVRVLERLCAGEELTADAAAEEFFLLRSDGRDGVCRVDDLPLPRHQLRAMMNQHDLDGFERTKHRAEMEMILLLTGINSTKGGPAYFPFLLLMADSESGFVFGTALIPTDEGVDAALARLPEMITKVISISGLVPAVIRARHPILLSALEAYGKLHDIEIEARPHLPAASAALDSLQNSMRRRR